MNTRLVSRFCTTLFVRCGLSDNGASAGVRVCGNISRTRTYLRRRHTHTLYTVTYHYARLYNGEQYDDPPDDFCRPNYFRYTYRYITIYSIYHSIEPLIIVSIGTASPPTRNYVFTFIIFANYLFCALVRITFTSGLRRSSILTLIFVTSNSLTASIT